MATNSEAHKASDPVTLPPPSRIYLTVRQLAQQQPALTEGGIRWAIFHEDSNGLAESGALARVGRRVLIDPESFLAWMGTSPKLGPPKPKTGRKASPQARPQYRPQPVAVLAAE